MRRSSDVATLKTVSFFFSLILTNSGTDSGVIGRDCYADCDFAKPVLNNRIREEQNFMKDERGNWLKKAFNMVMVVFIAIIIAYLIKGATGIKLELPTLTSGASIVAVFIFGLLTSIHCIGMCGGLMLTQCVHNDDCDRHKSKWEIFLPPALYNLGRVVSYTVVGAAIGGIGQALSLSGFFKGLIPIIGGLFMVLMALNILGVFPFLRHLQLSAPRGVVKNIRKGEQGPFILGLLMGIMPCGPLQMAEMYALTTGSVLWGALSMFVFALGTTPCLLALGFFGSLMTKRFSRAVVQCGAMVIIVLGVLMVGKGLAVEGINNPLGPDMSSMTSTSVHGNMAGSASGMSRMGGACK